RQRGHDQDDRQRDAGDDGAERRSEPPADEGVEEERDRLHRHRRHVGAAPAGSMAEAAGLHFPGRAPSPPCPRTFRSALPQSVRPRTPTGALQEETTMLQIRAFVALAALCTAGAAIAQQAPAEEPGWAKGRPKTETAMKMAPVPAFPIPTPADQLPTKKFKLPPGFKVETWASGVLDAREIREGPKGTIIVSTLFVGNKVYAFPPGKH